MSALKSKESASQPSVNRTTSERSSSVVVKTTRDVAQNFLIIIWDINMNQLEEDCQDILPQLQNIVDNVNIFTQPDEAIDFIINIDNMKAFLILASKTGRKIISHIHDIPQLDSIYILCSHQSQNETWAKSWSKIKSVHTSIKPIYDALELVMKQSNQNSISMSFIKPDENGNCKNFNQLEPVFTYTQLFKEIILQIEYPEQSIKDFVIYSQQLYKDNTQQLNLIKEFEKDYRPNLSIWWYTRECFLYHMLNQALCTLNDETIINMGFFIRNLHYQIEQLYREQIGNCKEKSFIVYRGQGLSTEDFEKLQLAQGGLLSFNNFLSTNKRKEVSFTVAKHSLTTTDTIGILFQISIDSTVSSTPFACISKMSFFHIEEEILFSMHSIFRIDSIEQLDKCKTLYQVNLVLTSDDNDQLRTLKQQIQKKTADDSGGRPFQKFLLKIAQLNKIEEKLEMQLKQTSDEKEKALCYNQLGYIKGDQGDLKQALNYYEKVVKILQRILPGNHPDIATSYNNMGFVYEKMGEYLIALSYYEKALQIDEKTLPPIHPSFAISNNNMGSVYDNMGEYSKALSFYEKALEIDQKTLCTTHPSLAISFNNTGTAYSKIGEYLKALSYHEKALEILQKTPFVNDASLAITYNNIGFVYSKMDEYSRALSYYEKALEIRQKILPRNHPSLATSYHNMGSMFYNMDTYSKALSYYEKALEIFQKTLSENHPDLATSYNNIGLVYSQMDEYSKAHLYYEMAIEIRQKNSSCKSS